MKRSLYTLAKYIYSFTTIWIFINIYVWIYICITFCIIVHIYKKLLCHRDTHPFMFFKILLKWIILWRGARQWTTLQKNINISSWVLLRKRLKNITKGNIYLAHDQVMLGGASFCQQNFQTLDWLFSLFSTLGSSDICMACQQCWVALFWHVWPTIY